MVLLSAQHTTSSRSVRRYLVPWIVILGASTLQACATAAPRQQTDAVTTAVAQPLRDLNVIQPDLPRELRQAAASPYAAPASCSAIDEELGDLKRALGPDLDNGASAAESPTFASALVGQFVKLPFRGLVRRLTGAEQRAQEHEAAVLGGMVRRGFLRGWSAVACAAPVRTSVLARPGGHERSGGSPPPEAAAAVQTGHGSPGSTGAQGEEVPLVPHAPGGAQSSALNAPPTNPAV